MYQIPTLDMSSFRVVIPSERARSMSTAELRVYPTKLNFNCVTAAELGYPREIGMLVSEDASKIIIRPMYPDMDPRQAIPFFNPEDAKTKDGRRSLKSVKICNNALASAIREKMGWKDGRAYVVEGIAYDDKVLLFDLSFAVPPQAKGKKEKRKENILMSYPPLKEMLYTYHPVPEMLPQSSGQTFGT